MKYTAHVPTEQYGYLGFDDFQGTHEEAVVLYMAIREAVKPKPVNEMTEAEFRKIYDLVASGQPVDGDPGILQQMSPKQQFAINECKKFIKRKK